MAHIGGYQGLGLRVQCEVALVGAFTFRQVCLT